MLNPSSVYIKSNANSPFMKHSTQSPSKISAFRMISQTYQEDGLKKMSGGIWDSDETPGEDHTNKQSVPFVSLRESESEDVESVVMMG